MLGTFGILWIIWFNLQTWTFSKGIKRPCANAKKSFGWRLIKVLAEGQSPLQQLDESPSRGLYLLVLLYFSLNLHFQLFLQLSYIYTSKCSCSSPKLTPSTVPAVTYIYSSICSSSCLYLQSVARPRSSLFLLRNISMVLSVIHHTRIGI